MRVESFIAPNGKLWSEMKKKTKKRVSRTGKLGIVRLVGAALTKLREQCFERDNFHCCECGRRVAWSQEISCFADERFAWTNALGLPVGEMAHIHAKRNGGDTLNNVRTLCPECHHKSHVYGKDGIKPVPKKERP